MFNKHPDEAATIGEQQEARAVESSGRVVNHGLLGSAQFLIQQVGPENLHF